MFAKLTTLACVLAVATSAWNGPLAGGLPAAAVPAGISQEACPNYPHCNNPNVAIEPNTPAQQQSQHQPQYQPQYHQPQQQYQPQTQYQPQAQYQPQPQYQPQSQYQPQTHYQPQPQYNPAPVHQYSQNALLTGEYTGDGDYRGEGLAESGAFGPVDDPKSYDATPTPLAQHQPAPTYNQATYQPQSYSNVPQQPNNVPAGVDPKYCPNYPFCS